MLARTEKTVTVADTLPQPKSGRGQLLPYTPSLKGPCAAVCPSAEDVGTAEQRFPAATLKRLQTARTGSLDASEKMGNLSKEAGLQEKKEMEITEMKTQMTRLAGQVPVEGKGPRTEAGNGKPHPWVCGTRAGETACGSVAGAAVLRVEQSQTRVGGCPPSSLSLPSTSFCVRRCPPSLKCQIHTRSSSACFGSFVTLRNEYKTVLFHAGLADGCSEYRAVGAWRGPREQPSWERRTQCGASDFPS